MYSSSLLHLALLRSNSSPFTTYTSIAKACGYSSAVLAKTGQELETALEDAMTNRALSMIEVMVSLDSRADLGRPKECAAENKVNFMRAWSEEER